MPEPTPQGGEGRPVHPGAADDSTTIQIPQDQVHPDLANAPHPDQTQLHTLKRGLETVQVTTEELIQRAQKGWNADILTEEAATVRKENAKALAVEEDLKMVFAGGEDAPDAFRRIGAQYGRPGDEVEEIIKRTFGTPGDEDEDVVNQYFEESGRASNQETRSRDVGPVDYSKLSPDIQRVLREAEKVRIDRIVQNALDKDEVIAYNMEAHTPEGRAAIRSYVDEKIRGRLDSFSGDFGDGTRILSEVLPEIREHLAALGTPGKRTPTGLGQAPGGGDTEVYPKTLPDHVPSTEGDTYEQHILETLAYHQAQAERGKTQ